MIRWTILAMIFLSFAISCVHSTPRTPASARAPSSDELSALALYHKTFDPICTEGYSEEVSDEQLQVVTKSMANRDHRLWHYFWHATRNSWHELTAEQRQFFISFDPRWQPLRLLGIPSGAMALSAKDKNKYDPRKNDAGEDFLFMHHVMMKELFEGLAKANLPCISPWTSLPEKDNANWPLPDPMAGSPKDEESYQKMEAWRKNFQSRKYLAKKSLGEMGYLIETSLHNNMHMRWATVNPPAGFGERPDITPLTLKEGLSAYDDPKYNWLADPYSAHVNKVFWKLHGLVEMSLFAWLSSQGHSSVDADCGGDTSCYEWKGMWLGVAPHSETNSRGAGKGPPSKEHHHGVGAAGSPNSFEEALSRAATEFVYGPAGNTKGPPRSRGAGASPEINRRKQVVLGSLRILNKNSPMSRGALNTQLLQETKSEIFNDPEEYVRLIEQREAQSPSSSKGN